MSRGDRLEAIFRDDEDREKFLTTLGETCAKAGWEVHAKRLTAGTPGTIAVGLYHCKQSR